MSTGNLHTVNNAADASADDINQFTQALQRDLVPRGDTGVPEAEAGSLGTQVYPWNNVYAQKVFVNGVEVTPGGGTSPGSIAPTTTLRNGVVSGKAPAGFNGMCGFLHQNGSGGVTVTAQADAPLVVKLDGVSYQLTTSVSGGTLPSDYTFTRTISTTTGQGFGSPVNTQSVQTNTRERYKMFTGAPFQYTGGEVPANYGDTFIFRTAAGRYNIAQRAEPLPGYTHTRMKLAASVALNTSSTGYEHSWAQLPSGGVVSFVRCGYVFIDPTTNPWNITIAPRIVGSVDADLPAATGYAAGDMLFLELDQRWYRSNGAAWQKSSLVLLGVCAIESGAVTAVCGVRTEEALTQLHDKKFAVLGEPIMREGIKDANSENIYFGGDTSGDLEGKGLAELAGQSFSKVGTDARVNLDDDGTKANNKLFCVYLDANEPPGGINRYFYEEVPPMYALSRSRLLLLHPHKHAVYVGSFAVDNNGELVTRFRIGNDNNLHRLSENNDDTWLVNASFLPRCRIVRGATSGTRRMEIRIRKTGQSSSTLRRTTGSFFNFNLTRNSEWDAHFYENIQSYVMEEMWYDTDANAGNSDWGFEISNWTEIDLLHAVTLGAAAREGRSLAETAAGAAVSGEGVAALDSIPGGALAPGGVGFERLDPGALTTEADILDPDINNPKLVTNVALNDKLEELEREFGARWGSWDTAQETLAETFTDGANLNLKVVGDITTRTSASYSMKTGTLNDGDLVYALATCDDPPDLQGGVLRACLLMNDPNGRRWAFPIDNPEASDQREFFYLDSSGNWVPVAYNGDELLTSFGAIQDDTRWEPVSHAHHDGPTDNIFVTNSIITMRNGNTAFALTVVYDTADSTHHFFTTKRTYTPAGSSSGVATIADGQITEPKIDFANTPTDRQVATWSQADGKMKWEDAEVASVPGANTLTKAMMQDDVIGPAELDTGASSGTNGQFLRLRIQNGVRTFYYADPPSATWSNWTSVAQATFSPGDGDLTELPDLPSSVTGRFVVSRFVFNIDTATLLGDDASDIVIAQTTSSHSTSPTQLPDPDNASQRSIACIFARGDGDAYVGIGDYSTEAGRTPITSRRLNGVWSEVARSGGNATDPRLLAQDGRWHIYRTGPRDTFDQIAPPLGRQTASSGNSFGDNCLMFRGSNTIVALTVTAADTGAMLVHYSTRSIVSGT